LIVATLEVGKMYRDGLGVAHCNETAISHFKRFVIIHVLSFSFSFPFPFFISFDRCIEAGFGAGEAELGLIYAMGLGMKHHLII
jgi:hypothetical protein